MALNQPDSWATFTLFGGQLTSAILWGGDWNTSRQNCRLFLERLIFALEHNNATAYGIPTGYQTFQVRQEDGTTATLAQCLRKFYPFPATLNLRAFLYTSKRDDLVQDQIAQASGRDSVLGFTNVVLPWPKAGGPDLASSAKGVMRVWDHATMLGYLVTIQQDDAFQEVRTNQDAMHEYFYPALLMYARLLACMEVAVPQSCKKTRDTGKDGKPTGPVKLVPDPEATAKRNRLSGQQIPSMANVMLYKNDFYVVSGDKPLRAFFGSTIPEQPWREEMISNPAKCKKLSTAERYRLMIDACNRRHRPPFPPHAPLFEKEIVASLRTWALSDQNGTGFKTGNVPDPASVDASIQAANAYLSAHSANYNQLLALYGAAKVGDMTNLPISRRDWSLKMSQLHRLAEGNQLPEIDELAQLLTRSLFEFVEPVLDQSNPAQLKVVAREFVRAPNAQHEGSIYMKLFMMRWSKHSQASQGLETRQQGFGGCSETYPLVYFSRYFQYVPELEGMAVEPTRMKDVPGWNWNQMTQQFMSPTTGALVGPVWRDPCHNCKSAIRIFGWDLTVYARYYHLLRNGAYMDYPKFLRLQLPSWPYTSRNTRDPNPYPAPPRTSTVNMEKPVP